MTAGRYLFIPFLRTFEVKSVRRKIGQAKNRVKKDQQDYYNCYKLRLRAINKAIIFLKLADTASFAKKALDCQLHTPQYEPGTAVTAIYSHKETVTYRWIDG